MAQTSVLHQRTLSTREAGAAELNPRTRSLFNLVSIVREVASNQSFDEIERTFKELSLSKEKAQEDEGKIQELQRKLAEVEQQRKSSWDELFEIHNQKIDKVKAEKKDLERNLATAKAEVKESQEEATRLRNANIQLNKNVEESIAKVEQAQTNLDERQKEIALLLAKIDQKEEVIQMQKEKLSRQGTTIESHASDNKSLKQELKTMRADVRDSATQLTAVQAFAVALKDDDTTRV